MALLERTPPVSLRSRPRAHAPSRPHARVEPLPRPRTQAPPRTAPQPQARPSTRLERSEARLLAVAIVNTVIVCGLLVVYLAAYARVSALGMRQAAARTALRQKALENDALQAELARLQSPTRVAAAAQALGMQCGAPRVDYIPAAGQATRPAPSTIMADEHAPTADNPSTSGGH